MRLRITEIGEMVNIFKEEMLFILFGPNAPEELREVCIIHDFYDDEKFFNFKRGTKIFIKNREYFVEEVGETANKNFNELGHISVYLKDEKSNNDDKILPGAIKISPYIFPEFIIGEDIIIV